MSEKGHGEVDSVDAEFPARGILGNDLAENIKSVSI